MRDKIIKKLVCVGTSTEKATVNQAAGALVAGFVETLQKLDPYGMFFGALGMSCSVKETDMRINNLPVYTAMVSIFFDATEELVTEGWTNFAEVARKVLTSSKWNLLTGNASVENSSIEDMKQSQSQAHSTDLVSFQTQTVTRLSKEEAAAEMARLATGAKASEDVSDLPTEVQSIIGLIKEAGGEVEVVEATTALRAALNARKATR